MSSIAPLQLLFEQPLDEVKQRFEALVESDAELAIEQQLHKSAKTLTLNKNPLGFTIGWAREKIRLSGYRAVFIEPQIAEPVTIMSIDLGPHIAGGERVQPIAKALLGLGADIAEKLSAIAVVWNPGKLIADTAFFAENVHAYVDGGVFPVLVTVDFDYLQDETQLNSTGLNWFAGQEIRLSGCGLSGQQLVRRAVRLVHDIATNGPVIMQQAVADLDDDKLLELTPGETDDILHCEIQSKVDAKIGISTLH